MQNITTMGREHDRGGDKVTNNLNACPFCGQIPEIFAIKKTVTIKCQCCITKTQKAKWLTVEELWEIVTKQWNARKVEENLMAQIERLEHRVLELSQHLNHLAWGFVPPGTREGSALEECQECVQLSTEMQEYAQSVSPRP